MANLNKVLLIGRLTKDPELKRTPNDIPVTSFTVAVNRYGKEQVADFIDVVAWRHSAEFVCKYFRKGSAIFVSGSLQIRTWKDKDGNNRKTVEVMADEAQFVESKKDGGVELTPGPGELEEITEQDELPF